jgi:MFS family permease
VAASAPSIPIVGRASWTALPPNFRRYLVALLLFSLGNSSDAFLMIRLQEIGVAIGLIPLVWFGLHLVKSLGNLVGGRLADRIGPRRPIQCGWLIYTASYWGLGMAGHWSVGCVCMFLYGVYYSLTEPAEKSFVTLLVGVDNKGLAFGWFHLVIGLSSLPASLVFGVLYHQFGALAAFGLGGLMSLAAIGLLPRLAESKSA